MLACLLVEITAKAITFDLEYRIFVEHGIAASMSSVKTAGLHPTAEQIEMFAYHLPDATLSNLIVRIRTAIELFLYTVVYMLHCFIDGLYFVCNVDDFKFLADMIQHIPLNLRARYVFCTAPINKKQPYVCTSLLKFARQFSRNEPLTFDWLCRHIHWPLTPPRNIKDLVHLEAVHDVLDLYLWLSYRFMDMFPDAILVRDIQKELDDIIQIGVLNITRLIRASQAASGTVTVPDDFPLQRATISEGMLNAEDLPQADTELLPSGMKAQGQRRGRGSKAMSSRPGEAQMDTRGRVQGALAARLIQQGLLTKEMLKQLEDEWLAHHNGEASDLSENRGPSTFKGKKRK
ncbi:hypothetical protein JD844_006354 [Phrynosoma platyrhinos]|uniref:RNA helicase n=1 Tax=Phrynosoma platyrhinos TaxID=52577 RepID=A0ABQ7T1K4_PHRPL|nr:hypothetical protein JD844_006354 [Phrynosoma platyrhinos]